MNNILCVEEAAQFVAILIALYLLNAPWWVYPIVLLGPDIGMVGYAVNPAVGALTYNLCHHKGIAVIVGIAGWLTGLQWLLLAGLILFGHSAMDRIFGYGLKYSDAFKHTHLGWIGGEKDKVSA